MSAFEYSALDSRGRTTSGVVEGDSPRQVRQQLRDRGLLPLEVKQIDRPRRSLSGRPWFFVRRPGDTDLALITRQIATLVRSGLPLEEALAAVARQAQKVRVQRVVLAVRAKVLEGHSLAAGLEAFPEVFPAVYRATVTAGEQSGHLEEVLDRLADYVERRRQIRQRITLALFYPVLLSVVAFAVVMLLLAYVVPQVVQVFNNVGQHLPWLTQALISATGFLHAQGLWLALSVLAAVVVVSLLWRFEPFRRRAHSAGLRLPLLGYLIRGLNTARFVRTLSVLYASGVPLPEALHVAIPVVGNIPMRTALEKAAGRVREGTGLCLALDDTGMFPPVVLYLVGSGERSGHLEEMLERAAGQQEQELVSLVSALLAVFEPLMILFMGAVVLVVVLAILLPIFELNQLVT